MTKEEFEIGQEFYTATGKWRCTDIGTRVIVAIHLNQEDSRNYNGPLILYLKMFLMNMIWKDAASIRATLKI